MTEQELATMRPGPLALREPYRRGDAGDDGRTRYEAPCQADRTFKRAAQVRAT